MEGSPASLLFEWQRVYELDPFGEERQDIRTATICMTLANAQGMKKRGGGAFKLQDFMPNFGESARSTDIDPMTALEILRRQYGNDSKSRS